MARKFSTADAVTEPQTAEGAENTEAQAQAQPQTEGATNGTAAASDSSDERFKWVQDPDTGQRMKRKDFILKRWTQDRKSRGDIAKEITQLQGGKKFPYQGVFAVTKKVAGGPPKADATQAASGGGEQTAA
jgi:hypothetical protein